MVRKPWWSGGGGDTILSKIALYGDHALIFFILWENATSPAPAKLQVRDKYIWADKCKETLRCFSKSAYLIFYQYCEYKYPMYFDVYFSMNMI